MIELQSLPLYIAALTAVYLSPGPDMLLIIGTSVTKGFKAGISTSIGIAAARYIHVLASGLGLAILFNMYPASQQMAEWIGAAYFIYLAYQTIKSTPTSASVKEVPQPGNIHMTRGFLTNILNPKALLFCSLLLPQFTSDNHGPLFLQFTVLGIILVCVGFIFDSGYAFFSSKITRTLTRPSISTNSVRQKQLIKMIVAAVFMSIAIKLMM